MYILNTYRTSIRILEYNIINRYFRDKIKFKCHFTYEFRSFSSNSNNLDKLYNDFTSKNLNYYEILNVSPKSSNEEIKNAFLLLAKQYHPDICKDNRSRLVFMKIKDAYDKLQDDNYRSKYDMGYNQNISSDVILNDLDIDIESLESEIERLDRYKRYVQNERNDIVNDRFFFLKIIIGTASILGVIVYVCSNLPKIVEFGTKTSGKSDVISGDDLSADKLVNAFYNPINKRWERVIEPFEPPTPEQLLEHYISKYPKDSKKIKRIQLPNKLAVLKTTEQATSHPTLLYDRFRNKIVIIEKQH